MKGSMRKNHKYKVLTGSAYAKEAVPEPEPLTVMRCPAWMPEHGKKLWKRMAPELIRQRILTEWDRSSFSLMCLSYSLAIQAGIELADAGLTVPHERDPESEKKNPKFTVFKTNCDIYGKFSEKFAMDPKSRQLLGIEPPKPKNPFEALLT